MPTVKYRGNEAGKDCCRIFGLQTRGGCHRGIGMILGHFKLDSCGLPPLIGAHVPCTAGQDQGGSSRSKPGHVCLFRFPVFEAA